MNRTYDDEDLALPLLRRSTGHSRSAADFEAEDDTFGISSPASVRGGPASVRHEARVRERFAPGTAGALAGAVAGAAALGVVQAMHATRVADGAVRIAAGYGIPSDAALPLAYVAAAVGGAVVGAGFASVTQHLRRLVPLLVWAEIFFVSLTMLVLAISITYGRGYGASMAPAILAASAVYAFLASFQLKLRVRQAT